VLTPLYHLLGIVLAFDYSLWPNYGGAIALLTLTVMAAVAPLTGKSLRTAASLQRLQPELRKLQAKYKGDRVRLAEEQMALYKDHGVRPAAAFLPSLIPLPIFFVLYRLLRGLSDTVTVQGRLVAAPQNISQHTGLYRALVAAKGHMFAWGIDLSKAAVTVHGPSFLIYWGLVGLVFLVQYLQNRQLRADGSAATAGGFGRIQRLLPWAFVAIAAVMSAAVNIYFLISGVARLVQTYLVRRLDPAFP
jgi:YidC/Oxa1 family membrane protein insertase